MSEAPQVEQVSVGVLEAAPSARGIVVKKIAKFGSLGKAGVQADDELLAINGQKLESLDTIARVMTEAGVGKTVDVRLLRGGKTVDLKVAVLPKKDFKVDLGKVDQVKQRKISPAA